MTAAYGAKYLAFHPSVRLIRPSLWRESTFIGEALMETAPELGCDVLVITSVCDGTHSEGSYHGLGLAWDARVLPSRSWEPDLGYVIAADELARTLICRAWKDRLVKTLGRDYDVILHEDATAHMHIERDNR